MTESTHATMTAPSTATRLTQAAIELPVLTVGIDLGDRHSDLCAVDRGGEILEESSLPTTPRGFRQRFAGMPGPCRA